MHTELTQTDLAKPLRITTPGTHVYQLSEACNGTLDILVAVPDAHVFVYGAFHLRGTQRTTLTITQHHHAPGSASHVLIKSVLDDHAHFTCTGTIHIDSTSATTHATFANHNLVVSTDAHVRTTPQLEVFPSTVQCSHSATVATLNSAHLHYLMTRGLSEVAARRTLIDGFLHEVTQKLQCHTAQR